MKLKSLVTENQPKGLELKTCECADLNPAQAGFTFIETLIALLILSFGLLSAGQLVFVAMSSASLARSKGNAALVAQDKLECLADLYRRNPDSPELSEGDHGAEHIQVPGSTGTILNRFAVTWNVRSVSDPRTDVILRAIQVRITVAPADANGTNNRRVMLNKVVHVTCIFSSGVQ